MLNVNVINAKNSQKIEVKPGQPASVKVEPGTRFELADAATGKAPAQIKGRRNGDNLEIVVDEKAQVEEAAASNAQSPDLVLENYYKQEDVSLFAGTGEAAVSYVPVDGAAANAYAAMNTSANTGAAVAALPIMSSWMGVAAAGTGLALAGGGGGGSTPVTNKAPVATDAKATVDENGVLKGNVPAATDAEGHFVSYKLTTTINSADGKLNFNSDGSYTFTPFNFDYLAKGSSAEVSFNYVAVDIFGATSEPKTVKITITGANDSPTIKVQTNDIDVVTLKETDSILDAKGTLTLGDIDAEKGNVFEQGVIFGVGDVDFSKSTFSHLKDLDQNELKSKFINLFKFSSDQITLNESGNLEWNFSTANDPTFFDQIPAGEKIVLNYEVYIQDKYEKKDTHDVKIIIEGTNDKPTIGVLKGDTAAVGVLVNSAGFNGTLTLNDVDWELGVEYSLELVEFDSTNAGDDFKLTGVELAQIGVELAQMMTYSPNIELGNINNFEWNFNPSALSGLISDKEFLDLIFELKIVDRPQEAVDYEVVSKQIIIEVAAQNAQPIIKKLSGDTNQVTLEGLNPIKNTLTINDSDSDLVTVNIKSSKLLQGESEIENLDINLTDLISVTKNFISTIEDHNLEWVFKPIDPQGLLIPGRYKLEYEIEATDFYMAKSNVETISINFVV